MNDDINRDTWNRHYLRDKSRQTVPDENVVRFIQHYLRNHVEDFNPVILEIGSGSGRNLSYLRQVSQNVFGMDFANNALVGQNRVVCALSGETPFQKESLDIVIAWGVLHYLSPDEVKKTLQEIRRILKPGGVFFGTIRSNQDTHLNEVLNKGDLKDGNAQLYSDSEALNLLTDFNPVKLGFIMRRSPGDDKTIAHHIFEASV